MAGAQAHVAEIEIIKLILLYPLFAQVVGDLNYNHVSDVWVGFVLMYAHYDTSSAFTNRHSLIVATTHDDRRVRAQTRERFAFNVNPVTIKVRWIDERGN